MVQITMSSKSLYLNDFFLKIQQLIILAITGLKLKNLNIPGLFNNMSIYLSLFQIFAVIYASFAKFPCFKREARTLALLQGNRSRQTSGSLLRSYG